jgi:hypothetical protein
MMMPQTGDLFQCNNVFGVVLAIERNLQIVWTVKVFAAERIQSVVLHDVSYEKNFLVKHGTS